MLTSPRGCLAGTRRTRCGQPGYARALCSSSSAFTRFRISWGCLVRPVCSKDGHKKLAHTCVDQLGTCRKAKVERTPPTAPDSESGPLHALSVRFFNGRGVKTRQPSPVNSAITTLFIISQSCPTVDVAKDGGQCRRTATTVEFVRGLYCYSQGGVRCILLCCSPIGKTSIILSMFTLVSNVPPWFSIVY